MNSIEKTELQNLSGNLGEILIDSILVEGIFKELPLFATLTSVAKLTASVSDRILLKKLEVFINNLNIKSDEEIEEFKEKYFKVSDYKRIGEKLLLSLERADSSIKISWLSKILLLLLSKEIQRSDFMRLSSIITGCYISDVSKITVFSERNEIRSSNTLIETYSLDHLYSVGLIETRGFDGGNAAGENSGTIYGLNHFGEIFLKKIIN